MIVDGSNLSRFVRKVLVCGDEKGVSFELVPAGPGRGGDEFKQASPFGKMPGFRNPGADDDEDFCLSDSTTIITYLEATFPDPALISAEPIPRARTIWFEEFADTILFPASARIFFNRFVAPRTLKIAGDEAVAVAALENELPPLLDYIEGVLRGGGFIVGDRMTVADIAIVSPFATLSHIGVTIDPTRWPKAAAYVAGIRARPSFADLPPAEQSLVARIG